MLPPLWGRWLKGPEGPAEAGADTFATGITTPKVWFLQFSGWQREERNIVARLVVLEAEQDTLTANFPRGAEIDTRDTWGKRGN